MCLTLLSLILFFYKWGDGIDILQSHITLRYKWTVYVAAGDGAVSEVRGLSGQIAEGDVVSSSAGALSCRMIIYAVGPTGKNNPEEVIKTLVSKSLKLAAKENMRSLAFPAFNTQLVSSYLCSEDALKAVVEAVYEFFNDNPQGSVKKIYLCTEDWQQCAPVWNIAIDAFGEGNVKGTEGGMEATDSLHGGRRRGMGHRRCKLYQFLCLLIHNVMYSSIWNRSKCISKSFFFLSGVKTFPEKQGHRLIQIFL